MTRPSRTQIEAEAQARTARLRKVLRRARELSGLSRVQLAKRTGLGTTESPIEKIELGPRDISESDVFKIARATGVDLRMIYEEAERSLEDDEETDSTRVERLDFEAQLRAFETRLSESEARLRELETKLSTTSGG